MRQTPFGVWNDEHNYDDRDELEAPMRQTPFGVWNRADEIVERFKSGAPMRQTPFGVWNGKPGENPRAAGERSNEADAFRRLESTGTPRPAPSR